MRQGDRYPQSPIAFHQTRSEFKACILREQVTGNIVCCRRQELVGLKAQNSEQQLTNCLIQCFNFAYGVAGNVLKASTVRKDLGIKEDTLIHYMMIPKLSKYYNERFNQNKGYVLINQGQEVVLFHHPRIKAKRCDDDEIEELVHTDDSDEELVKLYLANKHYQTYDMIIKVKCDTCGQSFNSRYTDHKCSKNVASFHNSQISKKRDIVRSFKIEQPKMQSMPSLECWPGNEMGTETILNFRRDNSLLLAKMGRGSRRSIAA